MSKGSGNTRSSSSSKPSATALSNSVGGGNSKIDFGSAPANYGSKTISAKGVKYTISAAPTGFGSQMKKNGRFTVHYEGTYRDFRWGDFYGFSTSRASAWKEVKKFIQDRSK